MIELPFEAILNEALKEGGEFSDLFFEQTHSVVIVCEEDRIEKVISGLEIGVGLRVLFDGRTIYSFTNQISKGPLLELARTLSRAVREERGESAIGHALHQPSITSFGPDLPGRETSRKGFDP